MESGLPPRAPRDATQRLLRWVYTYLRNALVVLWALTCIIMLVEVLAFSATDGWVLLHVFLALTALLELRTVLLGALLAHAPSRLSSKVLAAMERRTSRMQRLGQWYMWLGAWRASYFIVGVALVPWQISQIWPLPPSVVALAVAFPIMDIIARGPLVAHQRGERRRRANASSGLKPNG